jgi:hypothetical protein
MKLSDEEIIKAIAFLAHKEIIHVNDASKLSQAIRQLMEERDRYLELLQSYADAEAKRIIQFCDANIGSEKYATEWGTAKQALEKDDETNV